MNRHVVFAAALGLVGCAGASAPRAGGPDPAGSERVYVANQTSATVSVIDVESARVLETIDLTALGFDANSRPHHTATSPDGHWYVSLIGGGAVLKFDARNRLVGQAPFETPGLLAYDGAHDLLYVGRSMMAVNPPQRIGVIEPEGMEIEELDVFFPRPHALAVDGPANHVFAASLVENRIAVLDGASPDDISLADVGGPPHTVVQFALSPDRQRLVATTQLTGRLLVFDATRAELPLLTEVDVGTQPWHPVFLPDGSRVYMGAKDDDAVVVVETERWTVTDRITAPGIVEPHGSAVTADGRWVFVSNRNEKGAYTPTRPVDDPSDVGTVVKIDTATNEVVATIEVGAYPAGISIGPAGS